MSVNDIRTLPTEDLFEVKKGENATNATFIFGNEDHTLGNSLRHVLVQKSVTEFCGYSVPHPYEPKMNVRLQTVGKPAIEVLKSGLKDLELTADELDIAYNKSLKAYNS